MSVFKCKMCGGTLEINNNETVAVCEYCGTKQTLPDLNDEKRANLYDRANHFRRNNEFDKASAIYEQILNEDGNDAEAYWSLVLCRYGIEYVEDPTSHKRVPTVNRAQFTSVFDDDNYKSALHYADNYQKSIYEDEANAINEIQKGILAISQKEEPFDVFICYKESDNNGRRTPDSVLATELYHELSREGFKVFFSRITLEDKLGQEYEPYIFAALNSAKVMVVLGTKPEFFNAVWVKNEWSRFLALIKNGAKKMLIPAYKDMDPYDLPEEFSHLQAQDMSKLGFMQDLVRGIKKILESSNPKTAIKESIESNNSNIEALIDRALLLIEDDETEKAEECLENALNIAPKHPMIYVCKLMIETGVRKKEELSKLTESFDDSQNYEKAIRFADLQLKEELEGYLEVAKSNNAKNIYNAAVEKMNNGTTEKDFTEAKQAFDTILTYENSKELSEICNKKAVTIKKETIYKEAVNTMNSKGFNKLSNYNKAIEMFNSIKGYENVEDRIGECERLIVAEKDRIAKKRKNNKKIAIVTAVVIVAVTVLIAIYFAIISPMLKYNKAIELLNNKSYDSAYAIFKDLGDYKDSYELMHTNIYDRAKEKFIKNDYVAAYELFVAAGSYLDSEEQAKECLYIQAVEFRNEKKWDDANSLFEKIKGYKDSSELIHYHGYEMTENKDATCTKDGFKNYKCDTCGDVRTDIISAIGHDYTEATCTEAKKCLNCGATNGNSLGHIYASDSSNCSRCGAEKTFGANTTWVVDGQWELTIHSAKRHYMCNQYADENDMPSCVIITYSYKNLGYKGSIQDLYISSGDFDVYDGSGEAAETYPCTHTSDAKVCSIGMKCSNAQQAYALYNNTSTITLNVEQYTSNGSGKQTAKFVIPVS